MSDKLGYLCFYKNRRMEVYASSIYAAQLIAAKHLGAKKSWEVTVMLAERNGEVVVHKPTF